mgnify:CR=1 FL=1
MDELRELYQATILDHNRKPRNFRAIDEPHRQAEGHNPVCGDRLVVFLELEEDRISDIAFQGTGCAISVASASLMTDYARGKTLDEIAAELDSDGSEEPSRAARRRRRRRRAAQGRASRASVLAG